MPKIILKPCSHQNQLSPFNILCKNNHHHAAAIALFTFYSYAGSECITKALCMRVITTNAGSTVVVQSRTLFLTK